MSPNRFLGRCSSLAAGIATIALAASASPSAADWSTTGPGLQPTAAAATSLALAGSAGPTPWAAFAEAGTTLVGARHDGTSWSRPGGPVETGRSPSAVDVEIIGGSPYVLRVENRGALGETVEVDRFDGASWQNVGGTLSRTDNEFDPKTLEAKLASLDGVLYALLLKRPLLASLETGATSTVSVFRLDCTTSCVWTQTNAGAPLVETTAMIRDVALATAGGRLVAVYGVETATNTHDVTPRVYVPARNSWTTEVTNSVVGLVENDVTTLSGQPAIVTARNFVVGRTELGATSVRPLGSAPFANPLNPPTSPNVVAMAATTIDGVPWIAQVHQTPGAPVGQGTGDVWTLDAAGTTWIEVSDEDDLVSLPPTTDLLRGISVAGAAGVPYVGYLRGPATAASPASAEVVRLEPAVGNRAEAVGESSATLSGDVVTYGAPLPVVFSFAAGADPLVTLSAPSLVHSTIAAPQPVSTTVGSLAPGVYRWRLAGTSADRPTGPLVSREFTVTGPGAPPAGSPPASAPPAGAPPAAPPPPAPAPRRAPTPVLGVSGTGETVRGSVLVKPPGGRFVPLGEVRGLKLGTVVDARKGRIRLRFKTPAGKVQTALFYDGVFRIASQSRATGLVTLVLTPDVSGCPGGRQLRAVARKGRGKGGRLWGNGKGKFRTKGKYGAAAVRGTRWLTTETCSSTQVRVAQGSVTVEDFVKRKKVILRAGRAYTARARVRR